MVHVVGGTYSSVAFNSLYEIPKLRRARKEAKAKRLSILFMRFEEKVRQALKNFANFQFSLWDSVTIKDVRIARNISFNSLYEIQKA